MTNRPDRDIRAAKRLDALYKTKKNYLQDTVKRNYRIVELRGVSKPELVSMIMETEFGRGFPEYVKNGKRLIRAEARAKRGRKT